MWICIVFLTNNIKKYIIAAKYAIFMIKESGGQSIIIYLPIDLKKIFTIMYT